MSVPLPNPMVDPEFLARHVDFVLDDATIPELPNHYRGKVRDNYDLPDGTAHHHRDRPAQRLRPGDRRDPVQGAGADPDRAVLVRSHRRSVPATTSSNIPTPTSWCAAGSTSCRSRSSCATTSPARPRPRSGRCTGGPARDVRAALSRRACARTRNCRRPVITPTTKARDGEHDEPIAPAEIVERGLLSRGAVGRGLGEGAGAVRPRARDRRRARPDPGRHEIRIRARPRRPHRARRRNSYPGQQPLLVCRELSRAASPPASRPTVSTRIFCAAGWRPASTPTATRSRRSRAT